MDNATAAVLLGLIELTFKLASLIIKEKPCRKLIMRKQNKEKTHDKEYGDK